jgi:hypothetical protein
MRTVTQILLMLALALFIACGSVEAQTASAPINDISSSAAHAIEAANQYKASSKELLTVQENEVSKATAKLEELRILVSEGLVAKVELEGETQKLADLRAQLQATQKQLADADNMIAEIKAEQGLARKQTAKPVKLVSKQYGTFGTAATMLRYSGSMAWSLGGLDEVKAFFSAKFGHSLPTSAVGQSATHDRLGYDHRNAVDVALHPDSSEGRALISYLQSQGIPFLAFRGAIPGVATGPHIHIGSPSHRLS